MGIYESPINIHFCKFIKNDIKIMLDTINLKKNMCYYESGRQRFELPIKDIIVPFKTQEDFTSGIETRPGVSPPLWSPNHMNILSNGLFKLFHAYTFTLTEYT